MALPASPAPTSAAEPETPAPTGADEPETPAPTGAAEPETTVPTIAPEPDSPALATDLEDSFFETRRLRKDGWDGGKMAIFCGTLAETGVVTFASRACGMSAQSAYGLRHRNPMFDMVWEAALSMARDRLADELLARSIKGGAEQLLRDGCIVGERHAFDNKLAFAVLRRLDRRAELGASGRKPAKWETPLPAPAVKGQWQALLDAVSEERCDDAFALLNPPKVDSEVDNPLFQGFGSDSLDAEDAPERVWQEWNSDDWRTDFPPPPGFDGDQDGEWGDEDYSRSLTTEEHDALVASGEAEPPEERVTIEQDETERDAFFAALASGAPE